MASKLLALPHVDSKVFGNNLVQKGKPAQGASVTFPVSHLTVKSDSNTLPCLVSHIIIDLILMAWFLLLIQSKQFNFLFLRGQKRSVLYFYVTTYQGLATADRI